MAIVIALSPANAVELEPVSNKVDFVANPSYTVSIDGKSVGLPELSELPHWAMNTATRWTERGIYKGVLLNDLLNAHSDNSFRRLSLIASNGYKIAISADGPDKPHQALLAYSLNDELLDINGKGPFWLMWPKQVERLNSGEVSGDQWIWGLVEIRLVK